MAESEQSLGQRDPEPRRTLRLREDRVRRSLVGAVGKTRMGERDPQNTDEHGACVVRQFRVVELRILGWIGHRELLC